MAEPKYAKQLSENARKYMEQLEKEYNEDLISIPTRTLSMATVPSQRYILPTLQSNFNYSINEILKRMNNEGIAETWRAIETLFYILPPTIHEKVETDYNDIIKKVNTVTNGSTVDFLAMVESNSECCIVLETLAIPFFRKMYHMLYKGGYLEKSREVPAGKELKY